MIAVDTNILVYAHVAVSPWNARASRVLGDLVESGASWGIPWHCAYEFFAIVTNPKIYRPSSSHVAAIEQLDDWFGAPACAVLTEGTGTWSVLRDLVLNAKLVGPGIYDARIAAVCIDHGVTELWTSDRDFSRFPSLRT